MAKFQHSKRGQANQGWSDEVYTERQSHKSTVRDLIHLYDNKKSNHNKEHPPTQPGPSKAGTQQGPHFSSDSHHAQIERPGNYYSEEPRQRPNTSTVRRQHSQPRHVKQHSYSGGEERKQIERDQWKFDESSGSYTTDTSKRRSVNLASRSWATPDDVRQSRVVTEEATVYEGTGSKTVDVSIGTQHKCEGHPQTTASQSSVQASSVQNNRLQTTHGSGVQTNLSDTKQLRAKTSGFQETSKSSQDDQTRKIERHRSRESQFVLQPDRGTSQGLRSRPPDKHLSREKPLSQSSHPVTVHNTPYARARSQSPRTHIGDQLSRSSRSQSPSVPVKDQARTPRSSSTPRHLKEHRDSPREQVTRSHLRSNATPPPVQYNRQSFRSRSQSPHVNRSKEALLSHSHHTLGTGSQLQPSQVFHPEQTSHQHQSYTHMSPQGDTPHSVRYQTQSPEQVANTSHRRSQSPRVSVRHSKQGSDHRSVTSTSQNTTSKSSADINVIPSRRQLNQDQKRHSEQRKVSNSVSSDRDMKVKSQERKSKGHQVRNTTAIQSNNDKVAVRTGHEILQGKPPFKSKKEQQHLHVDGNMSSRSTERSSRSRQNYSNNHDNFDLTAPIAGMHEVNDKQFQIRTQHTATSSGNDSFTMQKESSSLNSPPQNTHTVQHRERLRSSPQNYTVSHSGTIHHEQHNIAPQENLAYVQLAGTVNVDTVHSVPLSKSRSHTYISQREAPQSSASNANNELLQNRAVHTPFSSYRQSPSNPQQDMKGDHNTSPQMYATNQHQKVKYDSLTQSPAHRDNPSPQEQRVKSGHNTPSSTYKESPTHLQQRVMYPHTQSPIHRDSALSQQQKFQHDSHTPSPTHRDIPVNEQQRLQHHDSHAPSPTQRDSPINQQQRLKRDSHTSSPTDRDSPNSQQHRGLQYHQTPSPAYASISTPENQKLRDSPQSNVSVIEDEYLNHRGVNHIQTYTLSHIVESNTNQSHKVSPLTHTTDSDNDSFGSENFVQTYSLSKPPPQDQRTSEGVETYSLHKQEAPKTFVETYSLKKEPESSKLSDISKALLGRSRDNQRQLQRSKSADVTKILSGPREKWNIDPPPPCGTIRHHRQLSDEPLTDPTYSYVQTGQIAIGQQNYPGEGVYSELQVSQPLPRHTRHASCDGAIDTATIPLRPVSTPHTLHYMSSPLYAPDYEVIPDSEVGAYEEPVRTSDETLRRVGEMDRTASQGEIVVNEDDNVSYLEPVKLGSRHLQSSLYWVSDQHQVNPTDKDDTAGGPKQLSQSKVFVRSNSKDLSEPVTPFEAQGQSFKHNQSGTENLSKYSQNSLLETTGSSSPSGGSRTSPDSVKRSYTATMIGSKSVIRQVTLLESPPAQNRYSVGGISEEDLSVANNFEADISGLPESFEPPSGAEDENGMAFQARRQRRVSRDHRLSIHSASSMPDLQNIGIVTNELRKSNEALHLLTEKQENLKSEMSKNFELLYRQTENTSHKKPTQQYQDITIHRVFKHVAQSVPAFSLPWRRLLCELFHSYPGWFTQWIEGQITRETRIEKECIHECLVLWKEFQAHISDVELMSELKRVLESVKLASIAVGINKILAKDKRGREQYIEHLDDRILTTLALKIGNEWKSLGIFLGFSLQELQVLESNHHKNMGAAIQEMLITWKNKHGPSVNVLVKGFAEVHRMDLVDSLRPVFISCDAQNLDS